MGTGPVTQPHQERRALDRRVGLPDPRPATSRVERRQEIIDRRAIEDRRKRPPTRDLTERQEHRLLVLYLAADPVRMDWLRRHVASHLERVAESLSVDGHAEAAGIVRRQASRHRSGDSSLW